MDKHPNCALFPFVNPWSNIDNKHFKLQIHRSVIMYPILRAIKVLEEKATARKWDRKEENSATVLLIIVNLTCQSQNILSDSQQWLYQDNTCSESFITSFSENCYDSFTKFSGYACTYIALHPDEYFYVIPPPSITGCYKLGAETVWPNEPYILLTCDYATF